MHLIDIAPHEAGAVAGAGEQPGALPDALENPGQIVRIEVYAGSVLLLRLAQKVGHPQSPAEIHGVALRQKIKVTVRPAQSGRKTRTPLANP